MPLSAILVTFLGGASKLFRTLEMVRQSSTPMVCTASSTTPTHFIPFFFASPTSGVVLVRNPNARLPSEISGHVDFISDLVELPPSRDENDRLARRRKPFSVPQTLYGYWFYFCIFIWGIRTDWLTKLLATKCMEYLPPETPTRTTSRPLLNLEKLQDSQSLICSRSSAIPTFRSRICPQLVCFHKPSNWAHFYRLTRRTIVHYDAVNSRSFRDRPFLHFCKRVQFGCPTHYWHRTGHQHWILVIIQCPYCIA